jgi:alpha-1,6-mannosyltransferase
MRIAQLANFYAPTSGGLRVAVDALGAGYRRAGDVVTLVVPGAGNYWSEEVIRIASPSLPGGGGYRVIRSRGAVLRALDAIDPHVIEAHDKLLQRWAWPWARANGRVLVAFSHERLEVTLAHLAPKAPARLRNRLAASIAARSLQDCHRMVVCSHFAAADYPGSSKVVLVPLGVDTAIFRPTSRHPEPTGRVRLIFVGRLSPEKRPDLAIDTLIEMRHRGVDADLVMLGAGPLEGRLRAEATGLPVFFRGFRPSTDVAAELAIADIALATGPAETFGLAALESLACGTPTVVVDGAATAELFEPADVLAGCAARASGSAFADAVQHLLCADRNDRERAARAVSQRYGWARTVEKLRTEHRSVAGRSGSPHPS